MRELAPDEKASTVIIYTQSMLIRGDLVLRENMRVSIWLRTQGVPNYIHLYNAQMIQLTGSQPRNYAKKEAFIPTSDVLGFHLAPPAQDPPDYDNTETNRTMEPVHILFGSFEMNAKMRVSTSTDFAAGLDVLNTIWISLYDAEISSSSMPQLKIAAPMLLARSNKIVITL